MVVDAFWSFFFIVNCWPSPSNNGTCEVNIEYELENEGVTLHDVVISIPLPYVHGRLPIVFPHIHNLSTYPFFSSNSTDPAHTQPSPLTLATGP